jgi:glycerol-3-phosphate dehydrogenase (NAD(P)+)
MMARDALPAEHMPMTRAIVDAVCRDAPLRLDLDQFHR